MKLYLNKTSPYARLVRVVAIEKGLADALDFVWVDPWVSPQELLAVNPFLKVPTLVTTDGIPITESSCICDYLEHIGERNQLMPKDSDRPIVLRKVGLGRGLIDVSFGVTIERRFSAKGTESELAKRWLRAAAESVRVIEKSELMSPSTGMIDMGDLAIAVGLSYTDYRLPEVGLRVLAPNASKWLDQILKRPSFELTKPE